MPIGRMIQGPFVAAPTPSLNTIRSDEEPRANRLELLTPGARSHELDKLKRRLERARVEECFVHFPPAFRR